MSDEPKRLSRVDLERIREYWRGGGSADYAVRSVLDHAAATDAEIARLQEKCFNDTMAAKKSGYEEGKEESAAEVARLKRKMCEGCVYDSEYGIEVCEHIINARGKAARLRGQAAALRELLKEFTIEHVLHVTTAAGRCDCRDCRAAVLLTASNAGAPEAAVLAAAEKCPCMWPSKVPTSSTCEECLPEYCALVMAVEAMHEARKE